MKKYMVAALAAACCAIGTSAAFASVFVTVSKDGVVLASWQPNQDPIVAVGRYRLSLRGVAGVNSLPATITMSVPEPATWAMMFVGLGMIGLATRRFRDVGTPND